MTTLSFDILYKDHGAAKGLQDLARHTDKTSASLKGMKVAAAFGLVAATAATVKFGISSVKAYSEAQTAQARLGDAFAKFPKLADTSQAALQRLNTELAKKTRFDDDATASGQAVLAQFKLTGQQITQLTPLLQDYAAKTGKDLPTAARDLGKAMLGQGRSLKAVGINFKDTGTAGGNFAQIMGGLRAQVGGFAEREGKTAAGQAEILKNQFGELQESVGKALLPALLKVGGGLLRAVNGFNDLSDSSKTALLSIGGGAVTLGLSALAVGKLAVGVRAARDAFRALGITAKGASIATLGIGTALGLAALAFSAYAERSAKATQAVEDYTAALKEDNNQLGANVRLVAQKALQDAGAFEAAKKLGLGLDVVTDAALGNQAALAEINRLEALYVDAALNSADVDTIDRKNAALAVTDAVIGQNKAVNKAVSNAKDMAAAAGTAGAATAGAGVKVKTAGEKAAEAATKLKALAASMFKASEGALQLSGSEISFQQAIDDATAAAKANGKTLDTNTQKGRDNKTSLNNLVTSSQAYISKLVETGKSSKRVTQATADARAEFVRVAVKMGLSTAEAKKLATGYFKIPKGVKTEVTQPGMKKSRSDTKGLDDDINNLNGKSVKVNIAVNTSLNALNRAIVKQYGKFAWKAGMAAGGVLPGYTPGQDVHTFYSPTAGQLKLSGGEAVMRPEWTRAVGGPSAVARMNADAKSGRGPGFADGGVVSRSIVERVSMSGRAIDYAKLRDRASRDSLAAATAMTREAGLAATRAAMAAAVAAAKAASAAAGAGGGPIGKGGYASALAYARRHKGHPYVYGSLWDCSGFMSALHSIILGQRPHRRYTTTAFHGAHAAGFTRGKSSPFRVGVRPLSGKFGHMAGTLNGVNVESSGGVGVRVGGGARGANSGMFSWRGGLAKGGVIGDLPFDLLDPQGERYQPWLADLVHKAGYHRGGRIGAGGPERVLSAPQNRAFEHLVRVMDRNRGGGAGTTIIVNVPGGWIGSQDQFKQMLVDMNRRGQLEVIKR